MHTLQKITDKTDMNIPYKHNCGIKGLSYDSRSIKKGELFFAVSGSQHKGSAYIEHVFKKGAAAVITDNKNIDKRFIHKPVFYTRNLPFSMAEIANSFYGNPSRHLQVVGITGTNGKTTISYILENICKSAGQSCGVLGTINYRYNRKIFKAVNTTPQSIDIQKLLKMMQTHKVKSVFMEVSSHALALKRVKGVHFCGGIFTNLTRDHLDFHASMEAYFQAKKSLFTGMNKIRRGSHRNKKFGIINTDNLYGRRIRHICEFPVITYGIKGKQDISAEKIILSLEGSVFNMRMFGNVHPVRLNIIGEYNIYNALASAGAAKGLGISPGHIIEGIESLYGVPGRMEKVPLSEKFTVIVDYAHTGDALQNVLKALHKVNPKRIFTVFGCGGDRDRKKRPIMGKIAVQESYHVWVTLDNPRTEDPDRIMRDIMTGIEKTNKRNYTVMYDRREAIKAALAQATQGDVVLIAGKGHEQYQILKDKTIHFDDREIVKELVGS